MNTGAISTRYARALLKYTLQTGHAEHVFSQVMQVLADPSSLSGMELDEDLQRFAELLSDNGRMDCARFIFASFVRMYCEEAGIRIVHLKTAVPSPRMEEKLREELSRRTGCRIMMDSRVDPELLGGFVVEFSGRRLDASARSRLDAISRQFSENNRRII